MVSGKQFCSAIFAVAGLFAAQPGAAVEAMTIAGPYVELGGGTIRPDEGARDADTGIGGRLLLGWNLLEQLNVQAVLEYASFEDRDPSDSLREYFRGNDGVGKSSRMALGADVVWVPFRGISPYALAGLGVARTKGDPRASGGASLATNLGLGLTSGNLGSSGLRLRAEARFVMDRYGDKPMDKYFLASVSLPLRRPGPGPASSVREAELPSAPASIAPEPVIDVLPPLIPSRREVDDRADVADDADSDLDGIPDGQDRCASTLPGMKVDEQGCAAEGAIVTLPGVGFQDASANMNAASTAPLRQVAVFLRGQPGMTFELRGHTDSVGDAAANQRLSEERARSVARFLEAEGIESWRITVTGFGESRQVADNATAEGRAANRRVELRVLLP